VRLISTSSSHHPRQVTSHRESGAARVAGIAIALISAILNLVFISAYPVWSTIVIAIDVIVIYAIVVHGRELKSTS
jgi:hypothetical protein